MQKQLQLFLEYGCGRKAFWHGCAVASEHMHSSSMQLPPSALHMRALSHLSTMDLQMGQLAPCVGPQQCCC